MGRSTRPPRVFWSASRAAAATASLPLQPPEYVEDEQGQNLEKHDASECLIRDFVPAAQDHLPDPVNP